MKALRLLWKVIRATDADRVVMSLLALILVVAALLVAVEPTITTLPRWAAMPTASLPTDLAPAKSKT